MWRTLLLACVAFGCLSGCSATGVVNYVTSSALGYSRLAADARQRDPQLAAAIRKISRSEEHQRIQRLIAKVPAEMDGCLVIEVAEVGEAEVITPAILAVFTTHDSAGFLSNFAFDAESVSEPRGGEWRLAAWPSRDGANLLPDDPVELIPSDLSDAAQLDDTGAARNVVILTLANRERVLSVALWESGETLYTPERMVRYLPGPLRTRFNLLCSLPVQAAVE